MWPTEYSRGDNKWCLDVWRKGVRQGHKSIPTCCLDSYTPEKPRCCAVWIPKSSPENKRGGERDREKTTEMWPQSGQEWPAVRYDAAHQDDLRHEDSLHWRSISWNSSFLTTHPTSDSSPLHPHVFFQKSLVFPGTFRNTIQAYCLVSSGRKLWPHRNEETSPTKDRECVRATGVSKTRLK